MNRRERRRREAAQRARECRLQKDAEEREAKTMSRAWAMGSIKVVANGVECFGWVGTKDEAIALQKGHLGVTGRPNAHSYAVRAAAYLWAYGMPKAGDPDLRPSNHGNRWKQIDIDVYKSAILWLALREHIPNTGQKLEDVFVGKAIIVTFDGDEPGTPLGEAQFRMLTDVLDDDYQLDPRTAVSMPTRDLYVLAGKTLPADFPHADEPIYVPRIPIDAAEAKAMLAMTTVFADATNPSAEVRTYAGYTNAELSGGRSYVRVSHDGEAEPI